MILVSACLIGINCKYNGKNNKNEKLIELFKEGKLLPICPEQLGGLSTPRIPAEIQGKSVVDKNGKDVTEKFEKGAIESLRIAKLLGCKKAILKDSSPSCGVYNIYDGTFTNTKIKGEGITAKLLRKNGIKVISEKDF